jgi:catechol 2,3-dioxygenase-like lactoylglutathione lyase family enzyme
MTTKMSYNILFVADMQTAIEFFKDKMGLELILESPYWSEFAAGPIKFALHPASTENPAGSLQLGFEVDDIQKMYQSMLRSGVVFTKPPTKEGDALLAVMVGPDGTNFSLGQSKS